MQHDITKHTDVAAFSLMLCMCMCCRVGSYSTKTATVKDTKCVAHMLSAAINGATASAGNSMLGSDHVSLQEGEFEMAWEKQVLVHMDDAMRVPKTSGLFSTVAHHFYEVRSFLSSSCTLKSLQQQ
ncbi:hypothetical protein MMC29_003624 [Sticta canariensis]|nr:hypothetical protein [Sticta canariensis]